jgi:mannosyltransferase
MTHSWLPLLLILLLAAGLRLGGLEQQSLWNDELSTLVRADADSLADLLRTGISQDGHPPAYLTFMYFVERTLGQAVWALRLPSAIAGVLSVWMVYVLARRLRPEDPPRGRDEGLIAAALMAVLWAPVYYSQEARPYAFAILLSLVVTYVYIPLLPLAGQPQPRARDVVAYAAVAMLTAYTHYFGFVLVMIQAGAALLLALVARRNREPIFAACAFFALGYVPWVLHLVGQVRSQFADPLPRPAPDILLDFLLHLFNNSRGIAGGAVLLWLAAGALWLWRTARVGDRRLKSQLPLRSLPAETETPESAQADCAMVAAVSTARAGLFRDTWATWLLLGWLILPPVSTVIESWLLLPIVTLRYLLVSLPPAYLLLARAFSALPLPRPGHLLAAGGMVSLCLFHLLGPIDYYSRPTKQQFREAAYYVADRSAEYPDGLVVANTWSTDYLDYYFAAAGSAVRVDLLAASAEDAPALAEALVQQRPRYMWYISMHRKTAPELLANLGGKMTLVTEQPFIGGWVRLYERPETE